MAAELKSIPVAEGQCGLCAHFGKDDHEHLKELTMIRKTHRAPNSTLVEDCAHPSHAPLHLKVNVTSGCDGFELAH